MNKSLKIIFLSLFMVSIFSVGVLAGTNLTTITAYIDNTLSMKVDNEAWVPIEEDGSEIRPITYNNRTYLPVRAVCEKFGIPVDWDGETNTVILGEKDWYKVTEDLVSGVSYKFTTDKSICKIGTDVYDSVVYLEKVHSASHEYLYINTDGYNNLKLTIKNTGNFDVNIPFRDSSDGVDYKESVDNPLEEIYLKPGEVKTVEIDLKNSKKIHIMSRAVKGDSSLVFADIKLKK